MPNTTTLEAHQGQSRIGRRDDGLDPVTARSGLPLAGAARRALGPAPGRNLPGNPGVLLAPDPVGGPGCVLTPATVAGAGPAGPAPGPRMAHGRRAGERGPGRRPARD